MAVLDIRCEQAPKDEGIIIRVSAADTVADHIYMVDGSEVPASAEVPMTTVRRGLHQFLAVEARPSGVESDAK